MKQIIQPGKLEEEKEPVQFTCHICGCVFKSDEYEYVLSPWTQTDMCSQTTRNEIVGYKDVCPECERAVCQKSSEHKYIYR